MVSLRKVITEAINEESYEGMVVEQTNEELIEAVMETLLRYGAPLEWTFNEETV